MSNNIVAQLTIYSMISRFYDNVEFVTILLSTKNVCRFWFYNYSINYRTVERLVVIYDE